jgi:hypothetical protein
MFYLKKKGNSCCNKCGAAQQTSELQRLALQSRTLQSKAMRRGAKRSKASICSAKHT